jgi:hypothetical protein
MPEDHFGEDVASQYDDSDEPEFDPAVIAQTVEFLASVAASGPARATRRRGPRHRPVDRDGRAAAGQA